MCSVQGAVCRVKCAVYSVQCALFSVGYSQCAEWSVQFSVCWSAVCSVKFAVWCVRCAVCSVQCAVFSVQCAACSVKCAVCSVQCAVWCVDQSYSKNIPFSFKKLLNGSCVAPGHYACSSWFITINNLLSVVEESVDIFTIPLSYFDALFMSEHFFTDAKDAFLI